MFSEQAYTYIGCYKDEGGDRDLESPKYSSDSMTLQMCHDDCQGTYAYFGVQVGNCFSLFFSLNRVIQVLSLVVKTMIKLGKTLKDSR